MPITGRRFAQDTETEIGIAYLIYNTGSHNEPANPPLFGQHAFIEVKVLADYGSETQGYLQICWRSVCFEV
jgi:hypothetical protein